MSSREAFLEGVRKALGRKSGQPVPAPPSPLLSIPAITPAALITMFQQRLEALGGVFHLVATQEQACRQVETIVGNGPAVASNNGVLVKAGITSLAGVQSGFLEEAALREACTNAAFGITGADYAMAETGTLVLFSSPAEARLISLLPPVHIALVAASRLLTGIDELAAIAPNPAGLGSSMVLITGPSRSADIEMILVRGVHGPRAIHVIVLEEESRIP